MLLGNKLIDSLRSLPLEGKLANSFQKHKSHLMHISVLYLEFLNLLQSDFPLRFVFVPDH